MPTNNNLIDSEKAVKDFFDNYNINNSQNKDKCLQNQENQVINEIDRKTKLENDNYEQDIELRKKYACKIFRFICWWCIFVVVVIFLQGSTYQHDKMEWNNNVIITLLTTTFAQVIGLMIIVLKYLFQHK